jgi:hypothetical protein
MSNLVIVRLRPLKSGEKACLGNVTPGGSKVRCIDAKAEEFEFDQVMPSDCSQQDVFNVSEIYAGFNFSAVPNL